MERGGTNYERVVLYVQNSGQGAVVPGPHRLAKSIHNLAGTLKPVDRADRALIHNRDFLVAFAKSLITTQAYRAAHENPRHQRGTNASLLT